MTSAHPPTPDDDPAPWSLAVPIETARLRLRPHRADDLDDLVVFHGDPVATRYIPWPTRTRDETRAALEVKLGQGAARAPGEALVLAMEEISTGTVIGEVLLVRGAGMGESAADDRSEVGYVLRTDRRGFGLATEAVTAVLRLAFVSFGQRTVQAVVEEENEPSRRLLERLGFVRDATADRVKDGVTIPGFVLTRAAWERTA